MGTLERWLLTTYKSWDDPPSTPMACYTIPFTHTALENLYIAGAWMCMVVKQKKVLSQEYPHVPPLKNDKKIK